MDIELQHLKCKPEPLHEFWNEISHFLPPADSTHLSNLPAALAADSFTALPGAYSLVILPDIDSLTVLSDADSFTIATDADSSMPSFSFCDYGIDEHSVPSFNLPEFQQRFL